LKRHESRQNMITVVGKRKTMYIPQAHGVARGSAGMFVERIPMVGACGLNSVVQSRCQPQRDRCHHYNRLAKESRSVPLRVLWCWPRLQSQGRSVAVTPSPKLRG
jgi:hypothetical protein